MKLPTLSKRYGYITAGGLLQIAMLPFPILTREIENEYVERCLRDGQRILDVGCGPGYSTLCHVADFDCTLIGVDFVPEMIEGRIWI